MIGDTAIRTKAALLAAAALALAAFGCSDGPTGGSPPPPSSGKSGSISGTTLWPGDTYVSGDIVILDGASLDIASGATVTLAAGASITIKEGGSLTAQGALGSYVVFKPASAGQRWDGIVLDHGAIGNEFGFCSFAGAGGDGGYALRLGAGTRADIDHCDFDGNAHGGVYALTSSAGTLFNCRFGDNGDDGMTIFDFVFGALSVSSNNGMGGGSPAPTSTSTL